MAILTEDIKLLKSAVMADTTDGGGAMTGLQVIDGQSNNLFPDTSETDRAGGRVQMRKIFGVAHSDDTDTLLGSNVIITDAPDDPLVKCLLMRTSGWADTRQAAREYIERYLVKGSKLSVRIYDIHYAGAIQLRLISFAPGVPFPSGGDAIVIVNADGHEQYVRVLRCIQSLETVSIDNGGTPSTIQAYIGLCDLAQPLSFDVPGPPVMPVIPNGYSVLYSTNPSSGASFYGIKTLGADAEVGDFNLTVAEGIYSNLVPAATVETPIIDQYPLLARSALGNDSEDPLSIANSLLLSPSRVLTFPSPIQPGTLAAVHGATAFTDDGAGNFKQGTLIVGAIDYRAGTLTTLGTAPNYGTATFTGTYRPSNLGPAATFSSFLTITLANQGLAYTNVFEPPPAPGSFNLDYMVQGRWYTLSDNLAGKVSGSDASYGVGTLNYNTGSLGVTLGAIPDVGSPLLASWADQAASTKVDLSRLPTRLHRRIAVGTNVKAEGITADWSQNGTDYSAVTDATGQLTGDATGRYANGYLEFSPDVFPDGDIDIEVDEAVGGYSQAVASWVAGATLVGGTGNIIPGSIRGSVNTAFPAETVIPMSALGIFDQNGTIYVRYYSGPNIYPVGSIDYVTRVITGFASVDILTAIQLVESSLMWDAVGAQPVYRTSTALQTRSIPLSAGNVTFCAGSTSTIPITAAPADWLADIGTAGAPLNLSNSIFRVGDSLFTTLAGVVRKDWNLTTGVPVGPSAGTAASDGLLTILDDSLPANHVNDVTWLLATQDLGGAGVSSGVFRTGSAPLKTGVMQLQSGANVGTTNDAGVISGGNFSGTVDFQRGVVRWNYQNAYWTSVYVPGAPISGWGNKAIAPESLSYNAVYLQYLPLDPVLLGIETARLPLDGRVPIFRTGDFVVVHNTLSANLTNPITKGIDYDLGRERIATIRVKDLLGVLVPSTKYTANLDDGKVNFLVGADLTMYTQPFTVENRIEDMVKCTIADISGKLTFAQSLTHDFPADTSYVSSALVFGDLFARAYNFFEQATFSDWSDEPGAPISANYNETLYPAVMTNRGAIKERWALVFTSTTAFRIIGESVGIIGTGSTGVDCSPMNPAVTAPYFTLLASGWGDGRVPGNVLRFNTDACGSPFWALRAILLGPATLASDKFTIGWRGDVDRP